MIIFIRVANPSVHYTDTVSAHSVDICGQNLKIEKLRIECSGQNYTNISVYMGVNGFLVWLFMISIIELPFAFM